MVELVLTFVLKLVGLGLGYYLVHSVFSKKTKDFHLSANQCGIEVDSSFYKEQDSSFLIFHNSHPLRD